MSAVDVACECGHDAEWHAPDGCGCFGWNRGTPECGCRKNNREAVEAIIARHVTAALAAKADEIEAESRRGTCTDDLETFYRAGLSDAARIVRGDS